MSALTNSILNPAEGSDGKEADGVRDHRTASPNANSESRARNNDGNSNGSERSRESDYAFDEEGNRVPLSLPPDRFSPHSDDEEFGGVPSADRFRYPYKDDSEEGDKDNSDEDHEDHTEHDNKEDTMDQDRNNAAGLETGGQHTDDKARSSALSTTPEETKSPRNPSSTSCKLAKRQHRSPTPGSDEEDGPSRHKAARASTSTITPASARVTGRRHENPQSTSSPSSAQEMSHMDSVPPELVLSPSKSHIYNRRQSTSPTRLPILRTPGKRDPRTYDNSPAPPSHETSSKRFNIFIELLKYPDLTLELSKHFDVDELVSLYAISKDFHAAVNRRFTTFIMAQSVAKASESSRTFIHRCYKHLCLPDPAGRTLGFTEDQSDAGPVNPRINEVRYVPSFRWLRMILFREAVVDSILDMLLYEGHHLPAQTSLVLKKLWFTLDISDNARRIGLMHNTKFWSNNDLFHATMFFVKLDMRLTSPLSGNGETEMKQMLLGQRSLSTLERVLARKEMNTQLELLRMIIRWDYTPPTQLQDGETILGVPKDEIGKLCLEGWGAGQKKFCPIDELVMRELVRRRIPTRHFYIDMMLYGFIDKHTFQDRRSPAVKPDPLPYNVEEEYELIHYKNEESEAEDAERAVRAARLGLFEGESEEEGEVDDEDETMQEGDSFASNALQQIDKMETEEADEAGVGSTVVRIDNE